MKINLDGVKFMLGMPLKDMLPKQTAFSIAQTMYEAGKNGIELSYGMGSASNNDRSRDLVAHMFLESDCDKLFWIDSDMVWSHNDFFKLCAYSTLVDIVLASYPAKKEGPVPFFVNYDHEKPIEVNKYGLMKINGAGFGFCCMDRKVVQAVADMSPEIYDPSIEAKRRKIFRHDIENGNDRTEDFAFFADAKECGFDVWMDPQVELGHVGQREWRAKFADCVEVRKVNPE